MAERDTGTTHAPVVRDIVPQTYTGEARAAYVTVREGSESTRGMLASLDSLHRNLTEASAKERERQTSALAKLDEEALRRIKEPSATRYLPWTGVCLLVDIFISPAVAAAYVTVLGGLLAALVLGIAMAILGRLFIGRHAKDASRHRKEMEERGRQVKQELDNVRVQYQRFRRWAQTASRRYPRVAARVASTGARLVRSASKVRGISRATSWLTRFFKNPVVKQGGEAIPVVNLIPFWTLGAIAAYFAHRTEYREARRMLEEYRDTKFDIMDINDDMYRTQLEVVTAYAYELQAESLPEPAVS